MARLTQTLLTRLYGQALGAGANQRRGGPNEDKTRARYRRGHVLDLHTAGLNMLKDLFHPVLAYFGISG